MKPAQDILRNYEYAFRQPEFVRPAVKYDNRVVAVQSLRFWVTAKNPLEKIAAAEVELPSNPAPEFLAEGYAAALEA